MLLAAGSTYLFPLGMHQISVVFWWEEWCWWCPDKWHLWLSTFVHMYYLVYLTYWHWSFPRGYQFEDFHLTFDIVTQQIIIFQISLCNQLYALFEWLLYLVVWCQMQQRGSWLNIAYWRKKQSESEYLFGPQNSVVCNHHSKCATINLLLEKIFQTISKFHERSSKSKMGKYQICKQNLKRTGMH